MKTEPFFHKCPVSLFLSLSYLYMHHTLQACIYAQIPGHHDFHFCFLLLMLTTYSIMSTQSCQSEYHSFIGRRQQGNVHLVHIPSFMTNGKWIFVFASSVCVQLLHLTVSIDALFKNLHPDSSIFCWFITLSSATNKTSVYFFFYLFVLSYILSDMPKQIFQLWMVFFPFVFQWMFLTLHHTLQVASMKVIPLNICEIYCNLHLADDFAYAWRSWNLGS